MLGPQRPENYKLGFYCSTRDFYLSCKNRAQLLTRAQGRAQPRAHSGVKGLSSGGSAHGTQAQGTQAHAPLLRGASPFVRPLLCAWL